MAKSSHKKTHQILGVISVAKAEQILVDWANGAGGNASDQRLFARHPEIVIGDVADERGHWLNGADRRGYLRNVGMAADMRRYLRKAWDTADPRLFDWCTWTAQNYYFTELLFYEQHGKPLTQEELGHSDLLFLLNDEPPEKITAVEAAISYLRHNRNRALHCPNPDCPAPYFFASKKGQKYCSEECSKPAMRASKLRWWTENRAKGKQR